MASYALLVSFGGHLPHPTSPLLLLITLFMESWTKYPLTLQTCLIPRPGRSYKSCKKFLTQSHLSKQLHLIALLDLRLDIPSPFSPWKIKMILFVVSFHYSLLSGLVELGQFLDGLKLGGLLELLCEHPIKACHLFMQNSENQLTAEKLDELFTFVLSPIEGAIRGQRKKLLP